MLAKSAIPFSDIEGVRVGNAQDDRAKTGVTVFYFPTPADVNAVGTLAGIVMEKAIVDAVVSSHIPETDYLANIK